MLTWKTLPQGVQKASSEARFSFMRG